MIGSIPMQGDDSFSVTFDNAVGAKTIEAKVSGKICTLQIPAGSTADGGGAVIACGAIPAHLRPKVAFSVSCVVTENGAKATGKLVLATSGILTFSKDAASGVFTDNAVAGWDSLCVSYPIA